MVIGIAGGVGSGKSTVLRILEQEYGAYICMADELGHKAMIPGTDTYRAILDTFGEDILRMAIFLNQMMLPGLLIFI